VICVCELPLGVEARCGEIHCLLSTRCFKIGGLSHFSYRISGQKNANVVD
jgi:hypothetical protein